MTPVFYCYCLPGICFPVLFILSNPYSCIASRSPYTSPYTSDGLFSFLIQCHKLEILQNIVRLFTFMCFWYTPFHFYCFREGLYLRIFSIFLTSLDLLPNWSRIVVVATAFISFSLSAVERYTLCYLSGYI